MAGSGRADCQACTRRARATKEKSCFVAGEASPYGWAALAPPKDSAVPTEMPSIETSYSWVRLLVSITLSTLGCVGLWSLAVALPAVQADFGAQRAGASLPYALTMIGFMIGGVTVGRFADRFGILPPFAGGTILMCLGYILTASAPTLPAFAVVSGLTIGLGSAASFAPLVADASLWFHRQLSFRRGLAAGHPALHCPGRSAAHAYRHRHLLHGHHAAAGSRSAAAAR